MYHSRLRPASAPHVRREQRPASTPHTGTSPPEEEVQRSGRPCDGSETPSSSSNLDLLAKLSMHSPAINSSPANLHKRGRDEAPLVPGASTPATGATAMANGSGASPAQQSAAHGFSRRGVSWVHPAANAAHGTRSD